jgi:hypothetical protein
MKRNMAAPHRWQAALMLMLATGCACAQQWPSDLVTRIGDSQKFQRMFPGVAWQDDSVSWYYNETGQPPAFDTAGAVAVLASAADKWSAVCGIKFNYMGASTAAPATDDGLNVIGWKELSLGFAALTFNSYTGSYLTDADVQLDPSQIVDANTLDGVVTHEWGHVLGFSHSDVQNAVMAGPPLTQYNDFAYQRTLQPDDVAGCVCLYGMPDGTHPGLLSITPPFIDFGLQMTGSASDGQWVTLANKCTTAVTVTSITLVGNDGTQFSALGGCAAGAVIGGGQSCSVNVRFAPIVSGPLSASLTIVSDASPGTVIVGLGGEGVDVPPPPVPTSDVAEFYNTTLNHYFSTIDAREVQAIDDGAEGAGWMHTGLTFKALPLSSVASVAVPVCRFYGTPGIGPNSHFYTAVSQECTQVQKDPGWMLETRAAFYVVQPIDSLCPQGTIPVYRAYNNRAYYNDSNHRFTTDLAQFNAMLVQGWRGEGVAWCAPK